MKETKAFDCLGMKRALQARLHKQWARLNTAQIQSAITADLAESQTELAKWWRKMEKGQTPRAATPGKAAR